MRKFSKSMIASAIRSFRDLRSPSTRVVLPRARSFVGTETLESRLFMSVTPDPGSSFATAYGIGELRGAQSYNNTISASNAVDTYSFILGAPATLYSRVRAYDANLDLQLVKDVGLGGNHVYQVIDSGTATPGGYVSGDHADTLSAGQYFFQIHSDGAQSDYLLRLRANYTGGTLATARNLGNLQGGVQQYYGEVGVFQIDPSQPQDAYYNPLDVYKFSLAKAGSISTNVSFNGDFSPPTFQLHTELAQDLNHDGVIEPNEIIASSGVGGNESIPAQNLSAGTYYILVDPAGSAYPNYVLSINADFVGNDAAHATNIGPLLGQQQVNESVGSEDSTDFYKFTLTAPGELTAVLSGLSDEAGLEIRDSNGTALAYTNQAGSASRSLDLHLNAGTYYALAYYAGSTFATNYSLTLTADYAGNGFGVPRNIGALGNGIQLFQDYVGPDDAYDYYQFTVSSTRAFEASAGAAYTDGFFPNLNPGVYLNKFNPVDDIGTPITFANVPGSSNVIGATLSPGTYQLIVAAVGGTSGNYSLALSSPTDTAGRNLPTAGNLGTLAGNSRVTGFVGTSQVDDVYKFSFATAGTFDATLFPGKGAAGLQIIQDKNKNGVIDSGDVIAASFKPGNASVQTTHLNLGAGNYYARVVYTGGASPTFYELDLSANYAGSTLATARPFGALSTSPKTFADQVDQYQDPNDYYSFSVSSAATVSASLNYTPNENTILELIQDKNHNGNVDPGEVLFTTANNGSGTASLLEHLSAGSYFLLVKNTLGGTNYTLSLHD